MDCSMKVGVNVMVPVLLRHVRKTSLLLMVLEHWYFNLKANMYVRMTVSLQHDRNMREEAIFSLIEFVVGDVEFYLLAMSVHGHLDCSLQVGMYVMMTVLLRHVRDKHVHDKNLLLKVHGHLYFNVEVCTYMVKTVLLWHVCDKSLLCVVHGHLDYGLTVGMNLMMTVLPWRVCKKSLFLMVHGRFCINLKASIYMVMTVRWATQLGKRQVEAKATNGLSCNIINCIIYDWCINRHSIQERRRRWATQQVKRHVEAKNARIVAILGSHGDRINAILGSVLGAS